MEVKTILVVSVFNIILPTLDTITDLILLFKLFSGVYCWRQYSEEGGYYTYKCGMVPASTCFDENINSTVFGCPFYNYPNMATAMLTPFLLNYFVCFITFIRKEKNKKYTFIFALLNIYPQFGKNNHEEKSLE